MGENIIFIKTHSGQRTNIMAYFQLWTKDQFIADVKTSKNRGMYRYGLVGKGFVELVKLMSLEEFDTYFEPTTFTVKEITDVFRKEISEKYGEHAEKNTWKPLKKSELERGCAYEDFAGVEYLYLGAVEKTTNKTPYEIYESDKKPLEIEKGLGFVCISRFDDKYSDSELANCQVLKGIKKFVKKTDKPKLELKDSYEWETGKMNYKFNESHIIVKLV